MSNTQGTTGPKVKDLSPDGYSRFYFLVDIIKKAYVARKTPIAILDVGGGSEFFEQQLDREGISYDLTVIDIIERPKGLNKKTKYIQADATRMPLEDNSYDVVVSTDVLEHIFPDRKKAFVEECTRVAKELFVLAAPFNTAGVNDAEIVVNDFNKKLFGVGQDWLEEHLELGKPEVAMVKKVFTDKKVSYDEFGTCNITTWLVNTHINLIEAKLGLDTKRHRAINRHYNENIAEMGETTGVTYRRFFIAYIKPELKSKIKADRYSQQVVDYEQSAQYVGGLISLLADRVYDASRLQSKIIKSKAIADQRIADLEKAVAEQQRELDKVQPILNIARSKPVRLIRRAVRGRKKEN